jgi:hypothetical protein
MTVQPEFSTKFFLLPFALFISPKSTGYLVIWEFRFALYQTSPNLHLAVTEAAAVQCFCRWFYIQWVRQQQQ